MKRMREVLGTSAGKTGAYRIIRENFDWACDNTITHPLREAKGPISPTAIPIKDIGDPFLIVSHTSFFTLFHPPIPLFMHPKFFLSGSMGTSKALACSF